MFQLSEVYRRVPCGVMIIQAAPEDLQYPKRDHDFEN